MAPGWVVFTITALIASFLAIADIYFQAALYPSRPIKPSGWESLLYNLTLLLCSKVERWTHTDVLPVLCLQFQ